ncbi:MAG TPA: hypothetical protein VE482_09215 [Candidatus Eisenbacteria bacterium]|nr:hypothetical protein [Candidatus Eisenbacteria bacterium]
MSSTERARGAFVSVVLAAATLLAVLEVTAERGADPSLRSNTSWASSLREMEEAIARGDVMSAAAVRRETYRAAITSRTWEGFIAAGDAVLRLGDLTQSRGAAEPDARRLYLAALFRAHSQDSLDGVLQATEAFARLGDQEVVARGLSIAHELAGSDPAAQARVRMIADRSTREAVTVSECNEDGL